MEKQKSPILEFLPTLKGEKKIAEEHLVKEKKNSVIIGVRLLVPLGECLAHITLRAYTKYQVKFHRETKLFTATSPEGRHYFLKLVCGRKDSGLHYIIESKVKRAP